MSNSAPPGCSSVGSRNGVLQHSKLDRQLVAQGQQGRNSPPSWCAALRPLLGASARRARGLARVGLKLFMFGCTKRYVRLSVLRVKRADQRVAYYSRSPSEGSKHMRTGRVETGRMEFSDDWPGVFIRGDDALSFALSLRTLLHEAEKWGSDLHANEVTALSRISELAALLESCRATARRGRARSGRKDNG
jgi:hypothetical protein